MVWEDDREEKGREGKNVPLRAVVEVDLGSGTIDELLQALDRHRTKACCFADDTNLTDSWSVLSDPSSMG